MKLKKQIMEDYNNGLTVRKILQKHKLSFSQYYPIYLQLRDEQLIVPRLKKPKKQKPVSKNYYLNNLTNNYSIYKGSTYYCCFPNHYHNGIKICETIIERLKKTGWDKTQAQEIKNEVIKEIGSVKI